MRRLTVILMPLLLLAACGGDDGDGTSPAVPSDAAVAKSTAAITDADDAGPETGDEPPTSEPADATAAETSRPDDDAHQPAALDERFPDVIDASATPADDGTWRVNATLSSPYDSAARYADAWRILAPDGTELGVRELTHDHAAEQPFTRSLGGVEIPDDVDVVTIEGRDQLSGWGGATFDLALPR